MDKIDIQLDNLFEHRGKPNRNSYSSDKEYKQALRNYHKRINNKHDNKANKINKKYNVKLAGLKKRQELNMSDAVRMKNANYKYHKDMVENTDGLKKAYHKFKKWTNRNSYAAKEDKLENKLNKKLVKNQEKRKKNLSESLLDKALDKAVKTYLNS